MLLPLQNQKSAQETLEEALKIAQTNNLPSQELKALIGLSEIWEDKDEKKFNYYAKLVYLVAKLTTP